MRRVFRLLPIMPLTLGLLVGPTVAAEPDRAERPLRGIVADDRTASVVGDAVKPDGIASVEGAVLPTMGLLAYTHAPYPWDFFVPGSIWVTDGETPEPLTVGGGIGFGDQVARWSPGGTMIAFTRDTSTSATNLRSDLYIMNADGSGLRRLTNSGGDNIGASWSPDGARIAFMSDRGGQADLYTVNIDGTDLKRITTHSAFDTAPAWSPDGTTIAFASDRTGNFEIFTMPATGGAATQRTNSGYFDFSPSWSPDGQFIAFESQQDGSNHLSDVFRMNADGTNVVNLTNTNTIGEGGPAWAPDDSLIAFTTDQFGDWDIAVIAPNGSGWQLATDSFDDDFDASWQPIPGFPLVDAPFSAFHLDIVWVYNEGITSGCSAERYCPNNPVTRGQMAAFLDRALGLPGTALDFFTDDETSIFEAAINRVAAAGITTGCTPTTYCPTATVTRGQMASFLARAFSLPSPTTDYFTDDNASIHQFDINRVAEAGITTGCTATTYCPNSSVTRGQMAAFLHRAIAP